MLLQNCGEVHILFCIKFNKIQFYILYLGKIGNCGKCSFKAEKGKKEWKKDIDIEGGNC